MNVRVLEEQVRYYRARAPEYDEWFLRRGRYDRGPALNRVWFAEVAEVQRCLGDLGPLGSVLELASGTGQWSRRLAEQAPSLHCVDASRETIEINRARLSGAGAQVTFEQANIFDWAPSRRYETVAFGFWLSHVPRDRFEAFWAMVATALKPEGRVFFVDSRSPESTTTAHDPAVETGDEVTRRLNDGREFRIVKRYYDPVALSDELRSLGWEVAVQRTASYFIYGSGGRA